MSRSSGELGGRRRDATVGARIDAEFIVPAAHVCMNAWPCMITPAVRSRLRPRIIETLESARIVGDTFEARLESLADVTWLFYRRPKFLA